VQGYCFAKSLTYSEVRTNRRNQFMPHTSQTAIFIDAENMGEFLKQCGTEKLLDLLSETSPVDIRKAYGCWSHPALSGHQKDLTQQGFALEHHYPTAKSKNAADIHMAIDIMKYAYTQPEVERFVIVSQDSDFSTVFRTLRSLGKQVIGVGYPSVLSQNVRHSCHEFIELPLDRQNQWELMERLTLEALQELGGACATSLLKEKLLRGEQRFSEKTLGFSSFSKYLKALDSVACVTDPVKNTDYVTLIRKSPLQTTGIETDGRVDAEALPEENAAAEIYWRALAKKQWHRVHGDDLLAVYEHLLTQQPLSRTAMLDQSVFHLGRPKKEVRKAMGLLSKAGVIEVTDQRETHSKSKYPQRLWQCVQREDVLPDVDYALMCHLWHIVEEKQLPVDESLFHGMVYGNYSASDFQLLMSDARSVSF
jgi:predicted nuclease of predicted toxin-antitoxin system